MKARFLSLVVTLLCGTTFASDPPVWNRPTTDITVGSAAYFDCQTPSTFAGTAAYMKLWVGGQAVALNHNQNRLAAAIPIPSNGAGAYTAVCQYSIDGVSGIDSSQLTITYGDTTPSDNKERTNLENIVWRADPGCNDSSCQGVSSPTNNLDTNPANTATGSGNSQFFQGSWDGLKTFEDEDWSKKRCEDVPLPGTWIYDFWVRQASVPHALEWGISQAQGSTKYRMAFQANYVGDSTSSVPYWRYFIPDPTDTGGSKGQWSSRSQMPASFPQPSNFTTGTNTGFTHVYFVGHPIAGPQVVIDAIQIGEANGHSGTENSAMIIDRTVPAYTSATNGGCTNPIWNLQSGQIDLDGSHTSDTMWMDEVAIRFQP
jgi:hypothetical protein